MLTLGTCSMGFERYDTMIKRSDPANWGAGGLKRTNQPDQIILGSGNIMVIDHDGYETGIRQNIDIYNFIILI